MPPVCKQVKQMSSTQVLNNNYYYFYYQFIFCWNQKMQSLINSLSTYQSKKKKKTKTKTKKARKTKRFKQN